jgi:RNA polymerase sigma-70 factor (ECF subfamily)
LKAVREQQIPDFSELVTQYGDELYKFALIRVGKRELAEDLVQETFLTALTKIESFREDGLILNWLKTILKNKFIDLVRSRSFREEPTENTEFFTDMGIWKNPFSKWFNWVDSPQDLMERKKFFEVLESCMTKLPLKQRLVIALKAFDGLSTEDICKELEITSSNEWVLTYRARLGLRECLEKNWHLKL